MRSLGSGVHLGVDLVKFDKDIEKAVIYAMGNAIVADSSKKAEELGFKQGYKVVDKRGTLINVNGTMAGGSSSCAPLRLFHDMVCLRTACLHSTG
jgi:structural maintenance of chromosome 1